MLFIILTALVVSQSFGQSCDDMTSLYPGQWTLVRHSYGQWFESTDSLQGTDEYGSYDNDPQSSQSWSIQFDDQLANDGSTLLMFTNGDCSQWMVTANDQFLTESPTAISATILASHESPDTAYTALWLVRGDSNPEDPWISFQDHGNDNFATNMYSESAAADTPCDATGDHRCQRWSNYPDSDRSLNVWIQTEARDCTLVAIDEFLVQCSAEWDGYNTFNDATVSSLSALATVTAENSANITALQTSTAQTEGDLADAISQFESDINDLRDSIDGIGIFGAGVEGQNVDGLGGAMPFALEFKDFVIILLVCVNLAIMGLFGCYVSVQTRKAYSVQFDESEKEAI